MKRLSTLLIVFISSKAFAKQTDELALKKRPKIEAGFGLVYAQTPHYPGSDQKKNLMVPFPTFIYRGDILKADKSGGIRGRFYHSETFEINLSLAGSLPVRSDNDEREGMPELDFIFEVGPGAIWKLIKSSKYNLSVNLPIRQAISTSAEHTQQRGYSFNPFLYGFYKFKSNLTIFHGASLRWATKDYHNYIYSVHPNYATNKRDSYSAVDGYVQSTISLGISKKIDSASLFAGYMYSDASQNANRNSPLFVQSTNHSLALGVTYWFYKSSN